MTDKELILIERALNAWDDKEEERMNSFFGIKKWPIVKHLFHVTDADLEVYNEMMALVEYMANEHDIYCGPWRNQHD